MSEENETIQRCPHDEENPYAQISRDLIRDSSISPECRWLIIYLLSMKDGWKINIQQIVNHLKGMVGRDRVYEIINEAIQSGYMKREISKKGNLKQHVIYFVSEKPKFKKFLRHPDSQDTEFRDTENQDIKKKHVIKKEQQQVVVREGVKPPPPVLKEKKEFTKNDLYSQALRTKKDWLPPEMEKAWEKYKQTRYDVSDPFAYIEGIIKKTRIIKETNSQKEEKCPKKPKIQKTSTKESEESKKNFSEKDMSEPPLQKCNSPQGSSRSFRDFLIRNKIF